MKMKLITKLLFILAIALIVVFFVKLNYDYNMYYLYGSAPFYLYVVERFIEYMILAIALLIMGINLNRKGK